MAKLLQKVSEPLRDAPDIFFRRRSAREQVGRRRRWSSRGFGDTGKSGSGGPLSDHLGLDALDAAIGVADGAIAEASFLEAWFDYVIEMGSANVEDAWLAWLVVKVARSVNF